MASADISPIVDRMVTLIESLPDIGRVVDHEVWDRDDYIDQVTSLVDGEMVLRAWLIVGPTLAESNYYTQSNPANAIMRAWQYRIIGIEGVDAQATEAFRTLRNNLVAVLDVLDADRQMGGTAHRTEPGKVEQPPELRNIGRGASIAVAYVEITKIVVTVSSP